jgi:hypothetical protein
MITWTSPADGVANITGDAWATQSTDDVWLEYIPADLPSNYIPGEYLVADLNPDTVLQAGTTPLLGGTVQPPYAPSWDPAQFGTSPAIPCGVGVPWCNGYESPLNPIAVQKGDVIAALIENYNTSTGEIAGLDLNVQFTPSATPTPEPGFWLQAMTLLVTLGLVCRLRLRRT